MVPAIVRTEPEPTPSSRDRLERRLAQPRMRRQAEIVVRGEVDDLAVVERARVALLAFEDAEVTIEALLLERVELAGEVVERIGGASAFSIVAAGIRDQGSADQGGSGIRKTRSDPNAATSRAPLRRSQALSARPPSSRVRRFVDDGVRGGRVGDRLPRAVGARGDVLQRLGQHLVLGRRAAAVAVDEPPPVQRRVEHVADVERRLAERQLDEDRRRRQLRDEAIDLGRGRARWRPTRGSGASPRLLCSRWSSG